MLFDLLKPDTKWIEYKKETKTHKSRQTSKERDNHIQKGWTAAQKMLNYYLWECDRGEKLWASEWVIIEREKREAAACEPVVVEARWGQPHLMFGAGSSAPLPEGGGRNRRPTTGASTKRHRPLSAQEAAALRVAPAGAAGSDDAGRRPVRKVVARDVARREQVVLATVRVQEGVWENDVSFGSGGGCRWSGKDGRHRRCNSTEPAQSQWSPHAIPIIAHTSKSKVALLTSLAGHKQ